MFSSIRLSHSFLYFFFFLHNLPSLFFSSKLYFPYWPGSIFLSGIVLTQAFTNYNFSSTSFRVRKTVLRGRLYFSNVYCSFPVDYTISVYMMITLHFCSFYTTQFLYLSALPFLRNWKQWSKSNTLTIDHDFVLENSSSAAVYTLPNTIYLKAINIWISDW